MKSPQIESDRLLKELYSKRNQADVELIKQKQEEAVLLERRNKAVQEIVKRLENSVEKKNKRIQFDIPLSEEEIQYRQDQRLKAKKLKVDKEDIMIKISKLTKTQKIDLIYKLNSSKELDDIISKSMNDNTSVSKVLKAYNHIG